jgi:hypothetical protein
MLVPRELELVESCNRFSVTSSVIQSSRFRSTAVCFTKGKMTNDNIKKEEEKWKSE